MMRCLIHTVLIKRKKGGIEEQLVKLFCRGHTKSLNLKLIYKDLSIYLNDLQFFVMKKSYIPPHCIQKERLCL